MTEREYVIKFANSVILLSKVLDKTGDKFLRQKLYEKITNVICDFVGHKNAPPHMSHNIIKHNLISSVNNLLDYLEYLLHISKEDITPLLVAHKNLLKFKLYIIKHGNSELQSGRSVPNNLKTDSQLVQEEPQPLVRSESKTKTPKTVLKSDSNKEKIYNFIKKFPDVRARDIMSKFNDLSGRTVKRNLKELTDEGFLQKKLESGAVYYLPKL